jgi:hypothetical protein
MSDAEIARQRAARAAQDQHLGQEVSEVDACKEFFAATGGTDFWRDKVSSDACKASRRSLCVCVRR